MEAALPSARGVQGRDELAIPGELRVHPPEDGPEVSLETVLGTSDGATGGRTPRVLQAAELLLV